jgi:hypothetical protein
MTAADRATLTARYLDNVRLRGARATDLRGSLTESDLLGSIYGGRYLSRPVFIGAAERDQLHADLENLRTALVSLPDRLYGGDLAAFARAAGAAEVQVSAVLRSRGTPPTRQARADLYADSSGFRLLEINIGSPAAGIDNADICRAMLAHPVLAEFAEAHRLGYVDTMREQVEGILAECGLSPGAFPMIAVADWHSSYRTLGPYLHKLMERWRELGVDAHACHAGELEARGGRIWLRDRAVDIVFRLFMIEHLLDSPQAPALADPILDAAARGKVQVFTALDSDLFSSKGALAMLSDERNRDVFTAAEQASFDRLLPWTRTVRPGLVSLEDGRRVDLLDYAADHQHDLVLKPAMLHSGQGVLPGWHPGTSPRLWRQRLAAASTGGYVIQRRIRPVPELFPDDFGELVPWDIAWGVFTLASGYGGVFCRAHLADSGTAVISVETGASVGCCLSPVQDPGWSLRPAAS